MFVLDFNHYSPAFCLLLVGEDKILALPIPHRRDKRTILQAGNTSKSKNRDAKLYEKRWQDVADSEIIGPICKFSVVVLFYLGNIHYIHHV